VTHLFVRPEPSAKITGGNLYNLQLIAALRAAGADVREITRDGDVRGHHAFVDSLYLDDLPRFAPCHLVAHYLPSLVSDTPLSDVERRALLAAAGFVVPSAFMADALTRLAPESRPVVVVAPGIDVAEIDMTHLTPSSRAIVVANLVPGKGVLPLLAAIGNAPFALAVVGSAYDDPDYARKCHAAAGPNVKFLGALSHVRTLAAVAASDFLVSPSRMESFGLALAEARALGIPIVARSGGNAAAHIDPAAGGALVDSDAALAEECLALSLDRKALEGRRQAAREHRPPTRSWADAARDFLTAFPDSDRAG